MTQYVRAKQKTESSRIDWILTNKTFAHRCIHGLFILCELDIWNLVINTQKSYSRKLDWKEEFRSCRAECVWMFSNDWIQNKNNIYSRACVDCLNPLNIYEIYSDDAIRCSHWILSYKFSRSLEFITLESITEVITTNCSYLIRWAKPIQSKLPFQRLIGWIERRAEN